MNQYSSETKEQKNARLEREMAEVDHSGVCPVCLAEDCEHKGQYNESVFYSCHKCGHFYREKTPDPVFVHPGKKTNKRDLQAAVAEKMNKEYAQSQKKGDA